jgi:hypothetical protein
MKKMEVMQMERVVGGNSFWNGVGCGLALAAGLATGPLGLVAAVSACMML